MSGVRNLLLLVVCAASATAAEPLSFAGPAMGTTYRVTLAEPIAGMGMGQVHREVDRLLATLDRALSSWRDDSDIARFHRGAAGEWIEMPGELISVLDVARQVHDESGGAFDVTAGPLVRLLRDEQAPSAAGLAEVRRRVGMPLVETCPASDGRATAIRSLVDGVELDLAGIGPGYAVDRIGERLAELGSAGHLVELGGEVRAWGSRSADEPWRVRLRGQRHSERTIALPAGAALATASVAAGRTIVDPRSGSAIRGPARSITVWADSCARADAWAVAALVLDLQPDQDGIVRLRSVRSGNHPREWPRLEPHEQSHQGGERQ